MYIRLSNDRLIASDSGADIRTVGVGDSIFGNQPTTIVDQANGLRYGGGQSAGLCGVSVRGEELPIGDR